MTEVPGALIGADEAAGLLEVTRDRLDVMIEEGLLVPADDAEPAKFRRADVIALSELGG